MGYIFILAGLSFVLPALAGFTFERQVVIDGVAIPPSRWGKQIQWPPLVGGVWAISYGIYLARKGRRSDS